MRAAMSQLPPTTEIAPATDLLVAVDHAAGTAAIVRDTHGGLWLSERVGEGATELHGYQPVAEPLTAETMVQGGRLPSYATGAEVVDDAGRRWAAATGGGAWLVVVDQPIGFTLALPMRYLDAAGETVSRPVPLHWPRTPVDDASEPCPACAGTGWDHVRPRDVEAPGSVVCRDCGHEEAVGSALAAPRSAPPAQPVRQRPSVDVDFPVYAAAGFEPRLGGWVADTRRVHTVSLEHGDGPALAVETRADSDELMPEAIVVRHALEDALRDDEVWPERSPAGLTIWVRTRDRSRRRTAARAPLVTRTLLIDGTPAEFVFASAGQAWAAAYRHGELMLVVSARGVRPEDVALEAFAELP
jgi:hypothetical protein